jgi:hypothetical protein
MPSNETLKMERSHAAVQLGVPATSASIQWQPLLAGAENNATGQQKTRAQTIRPPVPKL